MKRIIRKLLLVGSLFLVVSLLVPLGGDVEYARAGVWELQIVNASCSSVTVSFYYDGLGARDLYKPELTRDRFRLQVWNRHCAGGIGTPECNYRLADAWQDAPDRFGYVTMTADWAPARTSGNGIEVIVGQYDMDVDAPLYVDPPPSIVDRDFVGVELTDFYTCSGGPVSPTYTYQPVAPVYQPAAPAYQPAVTTYAYPAGLLLHCKSNGMMVSSGGVVLLETTFYQIAGALATATYTGQNQPIAYGQGVSLWALKSNELQAHVDGNEDATKLVVNSNVCGPIETYAAATYQPAATGATWTQPSIPAGARVHLVNPGENLFRISLRYGVTMHAIAAANGITNYNLIYAGQYLIIP